MEIRSEQRRAVIPYEGRTMVVEQTGGGVVTVRYQDEALFDDQEAVVRLTPDPDREGVRLELHREGREDTTLRLTEYDALAIVAALTASEAPAPPKG